MFGRVPLFYFVVHFIAAHAAIVVLALRPTAGRRSVSCSSRCRRWADPAKSFPPDFGYDLWVVYAVWIAIVIALYPLCAWFARVKERNASGWLSYL